MASYMGHEYNDTASTYAEARCGTLRKYRVGDRVRHKSVHEAGVGVVLSDEGKDNEGEQHYRVDYEDSIYHVCTDPEGSLLPAFRPGDRVKLTRHSGIRTFNERGTVSSVLGDNVAVRMDAPSFWGSYVAAFAADALDWERPEDCMRGATLAEAANTDARHDWQKEPKPKFKAGDVVRALFDDDANPSGFVAGQMFTLTEVEEDSVQFIDNDGDGRFRPADEFELVSAAPCLQDNAATWNVSVRQDGSVAGLAPATPQPCIVALINKDGQPRPSQWPHVHASVDDATAEAERLARLNPGQEFAVYQRVAGRKAEVQMKEVA